MLAPLQTTPRFVVAIPARSEAARLEACLRALDRQRGAACDHVVLLLNNCTDDSVALVERLRPRLAFDLTLACRDFPPSEANAGHARSRAMTLAAAIAGPSGIIATSDADGVVDSRWVACNRAAFARGAEAVCGRAIIDPLEALQVAPALHADDAREVAYAALLDDIHGRVDPDPADPLPRHCEHSGASIAVTVAAWNRAGGMAPLPTGEDRGFLQALRRVDARIRHAPDVRVTVSGRLEGRAAGGMAETMARRMVRQDPFLDEALEPALLCLRRAELRARARASWMRRHHLSAAWQEPVRGLARAAALDELAVQDWLQSAYFGEAWAAIEAASPALARVAVPRRSLARQEAAARHILARFTALPPRDADDPDGRMAAAAAHLA